MSARAILDGFKQSKIYRLDYNDKTIALRVKSYNVETKLYDYYDFKTEFVTKDLRIKNFLKDKQSEFERLSLKPFGTSLATQDEIDGKINVIEFKDEANAIAVLSPVYYLYN